MTTITINRATVEQALEALESLFNWKVDPERGKRCGDAVVALRTALAKQRLTDVQQEMERSIESLKAALAQQAEPVEPVEPVESALQAVAEKIGDQCAVWYGIGARDVEEVLREAARYGLVHGALAEPVEPVAWAFRHSDGTYHDPSVTEHSAGMVPLYPPPPQRKPLTDEEIDHIDACIDKFTPLREGKRLFARAVERALEEKNRGR